MINALLEILFLLTVSCLIGIFFTYRFWKSKYNVLSKELTDLRGQLDEFKKELQAEKEKSDQAQANLNEARGALATSQEEAENTLNELEKTRNELAKKELEAKKNKAKANSTDLKEKNHQIDKLNEQMAEKEREIESLHKELEAKKISYYKQIDGKRYKAITIKMADEAVAGKGDGRISKEDAEKIFNTISDGKAYTQVEKDTMYYLRNNYNWTEESDKLFRTKVRSWAAKHHELD